MVEQQTNPQPRRAAQESTGLQRLKGALDTLLVIDVFLVIGGALWFGAAVLLHGQKIEAPLTTFQALWDPLFMPAIGVLMAAAVISGALGWWQRRGPKPDRGTGS